MPELRLEFEPTHEEKVKAFKADPEKMKELNEFINSLIEQAVVQAELKNSANSQKSRFGLIRMSSGTKRIGVWSNRARGFVSRVFTAIYNCTNSVRNAATNRS